MLYHSQTISGGTPLEFPPLPTSASTCKARVCIATPELMGLNRNGGIGVSCAGLAIVLAQAGHNVTVLYARGRYSDQHTFEHWIEFYRSRNIRLIPMPQPVESQLKGHASARLSYSVFQWLAAHDGDFDVIRFPEWQGIGYYSILARAQGLALQSSTIVVGAHSSTMWCLEGDLHLPVNSDQLTLDFMERESVRLADVVVCPSQYLLRWCLSRGWILPERTYVQLNVSPENSCITPPPPNRVQNDVVEIVFFGRLQTRKGLILFCDALDRSEKFRQPGRRVTFLGRPADINGVPSKRYIQQRAKRWSAKVDIITDLGRDEAVRYLREPGKLAVIASLADSTPHTVRECLSHGVLFIAARTGGIPEMVVAEDQQKVFFDPTPQSLSVRLDEVLTNGVIVARPTFDFIANEKAWVQWHSQLTEQTVARPIKQISTGGKPMVSVCMATFNRPEYLAQALESLRRQDYAHFEVIVVDDGSTDPQALSFLNMLRQDFAERSWRVDRQDNQGPAVARNHAAKMARGEYLLFMDDDNYAVPEMISTFVSVACHTHADIVTCNMNLFEGDASPKMNESPEAIRLFLGPAVTAGLYANVFGDTTALVRKTAFESLGGFSQNDIRPSVQDWELFAKAVLSGCQLQCIPTPLCWYRVRKVTPDWSRRQDTLSTIAMAYQPFIDPRLFYTLLFGQACKLMAESSNPQRFDGDLMPHGLWSQFRLMLKRFRRISRPVRYAIMRKPLPA